MAQNSKKIKYSLHIKPTPSPTLNEAGDIGVNSSDNNRLHYNRGTGAQRILLAEDAINPAFSDATNISYDPSTSTLTATDVQVAIDAVASVAFTAESKAEGAQDTIDNHMNNTEGAHSATAISIAPIINLSALDVQAALEEHQSAIESKAEASDVYTKGETDNLLDDKADADDVYTKLEVDGALLLKADQIDLDSHTSATAMVHGVISKLVGETDTQTLTNKTIQGASVESPVRSDVKQGTKANLVSYAATPATNGQIVFATDEKKMYQVIDGELKAIGGGGGGGINFLVLNSSLSPDISDNSDAESSLGLWTGFDNGAVSVPTDMNTPATLTDLVLSRTNTAGEVLNGAWSFKVVKAATDTQGQGHSVPGFIPAGYTGKRQSGWLLYRHLAGAWVQGDIKWFVQWYDSGTSSWKNCEVSNNDMFGGGGIVEFYIDVPYSADPIPVRFGYMVCTTTTSGATFSFDDLKFEDLDLAPSSVVTKAQLYTPDASVNAGLGTVSSSSLEYRLVGEFMEITGNLTVGTVAVSQARLALPIGTVLDTSGVDKVIGFYFRGATSTSKGGSIIGVDGAGYLCFGDNDGFSGGNINPTSKANGNVVAGNSETIFINAKFKVKNVSNATLTQADTFWLSSVLASGTRVTTTPTKLGEYRTQTWQNGGFTLADSSTGNPTVTDGMRLSTRNGVSGTSSYPNKWEIYLGTNKAYAGFFFDGAGKTSDVDASPGCYGTAQDFGFNTSYSPVTGILTVEGFSYALNSARTFSNVSTGQDGYFDALISPKASPMAIVENPVAYIKDVKSAGTNGGSSVASTWTKRDLNTLEGSSYFLSLASSQITLPAGTYNFWSSSPAYRVGGGHKARLRNVTDSVDTLIGSTAWSAGSADAEAASSNSEIYGSFTISKETIFEVQHNVTSSFSNEGFGKAANLGVSEIYTQVRIEKVR